MNLDYSEASEKAAHLKPLHDLLQQEAAKLGHAYVCILGAPDGAIYMLGNLSTRHALLLLGEALSRHMSHGPSEHAEIPDLDLQKKH